MQTIISLDKVVTDLAATLYSSIEAAAWKLAKVRTRVSPDGSTASQSFELVDITNQKVDGWYPPNAAIDAMYSGAKRHWQISKHSGQTHWYSMTVAVESNGKFSVDFEYKDDYKEGDIMQRD